MKITQLDLILIHSPRIYALSQVEIIFTIFILRVYVLTFSTESKLSSCDYFIKGRSTILVLYCQRAINFVEICSEAIMNME